MKTPIVLTKVTLLYSPVEDRMRMTGQFGDAEAMVFWLTQRLCLKLVRAIGDYIEKSTQFPSGSDRDLLLSFQQSAAMVRKEVADPVFARSEAPSILIERIDITHRKEAVVLTFFVSGDGVAQLSLSANQARQWLGALRTQFLQASWSLDGWPVWMAGALDQPRSSEGGSQVH